jgi:methionine synthase II (cobalamin-independent)
MMKKDPLTNYKDVAVGVIDVRPGVGVEDVKTVTKRIRTALEVLASTDKALRRIWIDPDCGFRTTKNPDIAYKKMEVMMEAAKEVRAHL